MGGGANGSEEDVFSISGPHQLACVDWSNFYHRTAVTSSLVKGVYTMQRDRQKKRKSLANPWWESFGFSLAKPLFNEADGSIYGAVFEYDNSKYETHSGVPPRSVIAFRGTILKSKTILSDLKQNLRCFFNDLNRGKRFEHALQHIETVLDKYSASQKTSVWLAGHSLGAGIALLAGKAIMRCGFPLETYAFNPPNTSFRLEKLLDNKHVKGWLLLSENLIVGAIKSLHSLQILQIQEGDPRTVEWTPYLYVNPSDKICSQYIDVLEHTNAVGCLYFGGEKGDPIHRLSSAKITVHKNESDSDQPAHGLKQWWEQNPKNWKTQSWPSI